MSATQLAGLQPVLRLSFVWHILILMSLLIIGTAAFAADPMRIEAEAAKVVTLNGVQIAQDQPGYSSTGYAWGFDDDINGGDNIGFSFSAPVGEYQLSIVYYSP